MIYLLLNVIFGSAFMLTIKWVQVRNREDIIRVGAINYIVAAIWVFPELLVSWSALDKGDAGYFSAAASGATMGACYFVAYFVVIRTVKRVGASTSTVVAVLSILLPITCGVFIWGEEPNRLQLIGITLALFSLTLIGSTSRSSGTTEKSWFVPLILLAFFLLAGGSRLAQEAFKHISEPEFRPVFLECAFSLAALPSIAILIYRRKGLRWSEVRLGFVMGASNILQSHFMLKSLEHFDGFVVFPVTSAGAIVLTTLVATRLMGENISRRSLAGIVIAVVALVLLNWTPPGR